MTEAVPALVTLHVWRVRPAAVPRALLELATGRARVRRTDGVLFAKLLGTGNGRTFTAGNADLRRYALLTSWQDRAAAAAFEQSAVAATWRRLAGETFRLELRPMHSRGRWSRRQPFGGSETRPSAGPVAALTRARLRASRTAAFWRAVPPVAADLQRHDGLRVALAVGEAPVGVQGTFSLWDSTGALRAFTRSAAHADVVRRTGEERWYAEELFARFDVLAATGTLDGVDPLR